MAIDYAKNYQNYIDEELAAASATEWMAATSGQVRYGEGKDGVNNLMSIYSACTGATYEQIEAEFAGKGYGDFKLAVVETVVSVLKPLQDRMADIAKDKAYVDSVIKNNAEKANYFANKTLRKVQKKVGFPERIR